MKKNDFNEGWYYKRLNEAEEGKMVRLPHDAMRLERRSMESEGRHNIGWFESYDYEYWKNFTLPAAYAEMTLLVEFEGVYHNAEVYINGNKAAYRPYGYTNFYVDMTPHLKYGDNNEIRVVARNADQPNSRWYTGSGIYRPVWLYLARKQHILANGVKIHTIACDAKSHTAQIEVKVATALPGDVEITILDQEGRQVSTGHMDPTEETLRLTITEAQLWNTDTPYLYTCVARCDEDKERVSFGIRTLSWTQKNGLAINGEHVILKGACIHHDNGVLGACAFPEAEERKIRILKETGYNAIRSAHNPCSKALLEACDRLGMLVMDEYVDMWYIHKNAYDYAAYMTQWWKQDLKDMVEKDYNHPSVIMYSTGNEVAETGQKKGIELTSQMTAYLHSLDDTRPVSCGINIFFNFLYSMGFGVYSDDKAKKEAQKLADKKSKKQKTVGSEFYNTLAGLLGDKTMKIGATLHMCDVKTRDAYANMDVAGYNYGICRYQHDLKKYPNRLILGSETFCKDAYQFYELAKREPRIIGDFVWAGMDYIGEAGIGAWEYEDYAPADGESCGWLTAGSGRINILGFPNGEAAYTRVALEKEQGPLLAVRPVYQKGKHSPSAWKMTDAMTSWSWTGCEGEKAVVEVYARAAKVELWLNGVRKGTKRLKNTCNVTFEIPYESGDLVAVAFDANAREIGRDCLISATEDTTLSILPEKDTLQAKELCFIKLCYTDKNGIWKPMEKHHIQISVENGSLEGFGNACAYNEDGYCKDTTRTYYGEALAVVRAGESGTVQVIVTDESGKHNLELPIMG